MFHDTISYYVFEKKLFHKILALSIYIFKGHQAAVVVLQEGMIQ